MRLSKPIKKRWIVPKYVGYFYRCYCGNHLAGYKMQDTCEDCGAWIDWDNVLKGTKELEERRK